MATIFSHIAVPLASALGLGKHRISRRLMLVGMLASILPDFDTIGFIFGVPYASPFGHRGFTHSVLMSGLVGLIAMFFYRKLLTTRLTAWLFVSFSMLSHALLDMLTSGGLGVALYWPMSEARYFFDWRVIKVSPIGAGFFSQRGLAVLQSELYSIWLPCAIWAATLYVLLRNRK